MNTIDKKRISLKRAAELKGRIADFLEIRATIPKGLEAAEILAGRKRKILQVLNGTEADWEDYRWQLKNRISDVHTLGKIINLTKKEKWEIAEVGKHFRWALSPYYASLINPDDPYDPIRLMAIPVYHELLDTCAEADPMHEEYTNPAGSITRRYPDRIIINVTNECAMYCRHCQRRRNFGKKDRPKTKAILQESIDYVRTNKEIRDVLLTGGDALCLSDTYLEWIIQQLRTIPHVEYIRLGTRTPVTLPQRITKKLCKMLKKYHPLYINTQFNHPIEVTPAAKAACEMLADAGIPLGNQAVLLNGINNDKHVMKVLNHELLKCRVKPYYIFLAKRVKGTTHFNTSITDGLEIMEYLRGYTSGMAVPTFIVNAPTGLGKVPLNPNYIISQGPGYVTFRTWEGKVIKYQDHKTRDIKELLSQDYPVNDLGTMTS
ncbi:MAG TPA: glutamate 2,3-aminomutase [Peptococcaceae bacterium]|jgi:glutamate 2,3-aminomutase|nr:glutamate 2,3-aminomutase [Clostridia bacterium]HOB81352.1 glutamate 2,3-aminomutase [Peptococcaceae bacterium]HPZ71659.1 glutamate 2,3-aminomutase [Peptococcaceae bacterium]HQD54562.1 glutamate 2,3-aminomutase [Peptococcaceae bacterium]